MRTSISVLFIASFFLPFQVLAALNAGVVNGIWFSQPTPEAGEEILIYTAVQNTSHEEISGTVAFLVNDTIVGTTAFRVGSNEVVAVSVPHTFSDGSNKVRAYIESVVDESVVYTTVADTPISVAQSAKQTQEVQTQAQTASSTLSDLPTATKEKAQEVIDTISPTIENVAKRVESFRDTLVYSTATSTSPARTNTDDTSDTQKQSLKQATHTFTESSKAIVTASEVSLWKKVIGIGMTVVAFLMRLWFIFFVLILVYIFWRLVRGARIR